MQIIEKSALGVRAAIYGLQQENSLTEFLLFPMIHVGEQQYYDEVGKLLANCDVILSEGVSSKRVKLLTMSYEIVKKVRRMDLVTQREALPLSGRRQKIIKADLSGNDFDHRWANLPVWLRCQLLVLLPIYTVHLLLFGTRQMLAENLALDDLPSDEEVLMDEGMFEKLDELIVNERDRHIIRKIDEYRQADMQTRRVIGILYGAAHMRAVVRYLMEKLNYRVASARWVTVFDL